MSQVSIGRWMQSGRGGPSAVSANGFVFSIRAIEQARAAAAGKCIIDCPAAKFTSGAHQIKIRARSVAGLLAVWMQLQHGDKDKLLWESTGVTSVARTAAQWNEPNRDYELTVRKTERRRRAAHASCSVC